MPDKTGKPTGGNKGSVDYWTNKTNKDGTFVDPPGDLEFKNKVIDARLKSQSEGKKFSDEMY